MRLFRSKSRLAFASSKQIKAPLWYVHANKYSIFFSKEYIFITKIHFLTTKSSKRTNLPCVFFRKAFFRWNLKLYLQSFEPSRRAFTPLSWYALLAFQGERGRGWRGLLRFPRRPSGYLSPWYTLLAFQGERGIGRRGLLRFPRRPSGYPSLMVCASRIPRWERVGTAWSSPFPLPPFGLSLSHGMRFTHSKEREGLDN